jgi:formyl-CoA transferase
VKTRLGIDYETLRAINPRLVYASISGFGQDGPYADRPGFDQIAQGLGGLMSIPGAPGGGPMRVGIPIADLTAGLYCAMGILIALLARERTGEGQWVQTSLLQAQVSLLDFQAVRWLMKGEVPRQAGNNHPTSIPTGVFATADDPINIAVTGNAIWTRFCGVVGHEEWLEDERFATAAARLANRDALNALIGSVLTGDKAAAWIERFNAAGVPAGPINTIDKVFEDPQVRHLGLSRAFTSPALGEVTVLGQAIRLSAAESAIVRPPPEMGEHSREILAELGFDESEIDAFAQSGVI